jgi:hypothetical protein
MRLRNEYHGNLADGQPYQPYIGFIEPEGRAMKKSEIVVLMPHDKDTIDVEMWLNNSLIGILSPSGNGTELELFPPKGQPSLRLSLQEFEDIFTRARERLRQYEDR